MEKLKEMVIKLAISQKNQPLSSSQIDLIHQRLHHEFPFGVRTPNHPNYAHMINKAIKELNEEDGSTEAMISKYIKEQFEDLPWAHSSILNHHLNKLCANGHLVFNASKRYSKPLFNEVQEFKLVNETSTRLESASFPEENELMEVDGTRDEHLPSLCKIALLEENPGQKEQDTCEKRDVVITEINKPKMIGWTVDEALQDKSLVETKTIVKALQSHCKTRTIVHALQVHALQSHGNGSVVKRKKNPRIDRIVVCGLSAIMPDPIKPKRSNTRKRRSKGKSTELTPSSLDSPSSNVLSLENDCHSTELVVVSKKRRSSDVKEREEKATKLPNPIVTRRYNTRKRKSKGKSTELTLASLDSPSSNVLSLENDCHGTELVVVPKKSESSDVMKKKKESTEPAKLPDPNNTRNSKRKSKGKSTELIPDPLDSPSSNQQGALAICQEESKTIHSEESKWPSWVESLVQTRFFGKCEVHLNTNKSICNVYCLDCMNGAICASCVTDSHNDHRVIRVRSTKYEDAVNVSTIQTYLDISGIQIHKVHSSNVLSLKRMRRSKIHRANCAPCVCLIRQVPNPFSFCSLSCKYKNQLDVGAPSMIE